jgi:hypothetical protein
MVFLHKAMLKSDGRDGPWSYVTLNLLAFCSKVRHLKPIKILWIHRRPPTLFQYYPQFHVFILFICCLFKSVLRVRTVQSVTMRGLVSEWWIWIDEGERGHVPIWGKLLSVRIAGVVIEVWTWHFPNINKEFDILLWKHIWGYVIISQGIPTEVKSRIFSEVCNSIEVLVPILC